MNKTRKRRRPILNRAGKETARAKSSVRIPFVPSIRRRILPMRTIRITRNNVGLTKNLAIISPKVCPEGKQFILRFNENLNLPRIDAMTMTKSKIFHGIVKYFIFNAISFIKHSIANLNSNIIFQISFQILSYIPTKMWLINPRRKSYVELWL